MARMPSDAVARARWRSCLRLTAWLLVVWSLVTFGVSFFARELDFTVLGWPFSFWMASQGAPIVYLALVCVYAVLMRRLDEAFGVAEDD